jgi:hypothetical protein
MRAFCRTAPRGGCDALRGWPAEAFAASAAAAVPVAGAVPAAAARAGRRGHRARWARSGGSGYSHDQFGLLTLAAPPRGIRPGQGDARHVFA